MDYASIDRHAQYTCEAPVDLDLILEQVFAERQQPGSSEPVDLALRDGAGTELTVLFHPRVVEARVDGFRVDGEIFTDSVRLHIGDRGLVEAIDVRWLDPVEVYLWIRERLSPNAVSTASILFELVELGYEVALADREAQVCRFGHASSVRLMTWDETRDYMLGEAGVMDITWESGEVSRFVGQSLTGGYDRDSRHFGEPADDGGDVVDPDGYTTVNVSALVPHLKDDTTEGLIVEDVELAKAMLRVLAHMESPRPDLSHSAPRIAADRRFGRESQFSKVLQELQWRAGDDDANPFR
jgi:hypothetical protein